MSAAVDRIGDAVDRLGRVGRAEGIEAGGPLGVWLEAQVEALRGLADIMRDQDARQGEVLARFEAQAAARLRDLREALEGANHVVKQGEFALRQARQVQLGVVVERELLVRTMIKETLPLFAERLKAALVIRERGWNAKARDRRFVLAAVIAGGIFFAGYGFAWWQDGGRVAAFDRCLAHPLSSGGRYYCPVDDLLLGVGGPAPAQTER